MASTGVRNKRIGGFDPEEPKMKTVTVNFYGSYEMEVPVDWDDQEVKLEADRYEVEQWEIEVE